jgi:prepilin-type N-terminal cleavage/methylation domain-containing protein
MEKENNNKGFSLIELIVVIAIIGILVTFAAPKFMGYTKDAKVSRMQTDARILSTASVLYNLENNGDWPSEGGDASIGTVLTGRLPGEQIITLDKSLLKPYVKNISGDYEDYGLIISNGEYETDVVHLKGIEDKDGVTWFGVNISVENNDNN